MQIAFAGHNRAEDLGDRPPIFEQLGRAFAMLRAAGVSEARLLTGLASGADVLAAEAWVATGLGPVHAVLPYLDFETDTYLGPFGLAESATWLDGVSAEAAGRNAHLKQTRIIVEAADMVVVVWNGEPARGAGGTADAVQAALRLGLPVLWLQPNHPYDVRLILPHMLPADFHFPEFQEGLKNGDLRHVQEATPARINAALAQARTAPLPADPPSRPIHDAIDRLMHRTLWKTHKIFRNLLGGRVHVEASEDDGSPPPGLAAQPGFQALSEAYTLADSQANRLAAVHRSEQVLMTLAMVVAAAVGSAWTLWPEFKLTGVSIELAISVVGLIVWALAADARQNERWGEFRFLAERLRLERASWAMGIGIARGAGRRHDGEDGAWRQVRRDAGLPHGPFDADRVVSWSRWALNELVWGQAAYHRAVSVRDARFAHRIQRIEFIAFMVFFVIFASYLISYGVGELGHHWPSWWPGVIAIVGSVVPALAAAIMALEAKLEPEEQSERSHRIAESLDQLRARLTPVSTFDDMQTVAREAIAMHLAESAYWQEGVNRRRLFRA